jgi:GSH-dependent disulfide-bond oxidoreductase
MIDLYTSSTPNGWKASVALEEMALPYEVHPVSLSKGDQKQDWFLKINPNGRIPAIVDRDEDNFAVFESGAILIYLAEKCGKLMPKDVKGRSLVIQWLMFQMGGIGPMFGQVGFFHKFAGKEYEDKRPRDRYIAESRRLLNVLNDRLSERQWIMGDTYSIADIATFPWVRNLIGFYEAGDLVGFGDFAHVKRALEMFVERPAVVKGLNIPSRN